MAMTKRWLSIISVCICYIFPSIQWISINCSYKINCIDENQPREFNATELMVIDGLKQLTKVIFRQQYKTVTNSPVKNMPMSPSKMNINRTSGGSTPNASVAQSPSKCCVSAQHMDNAMLAAEKFCSMVVRQIDAMDKAGNVHTNQLDVYHSVHKKLFQDGN